MNYMIYGEEAYQVRKAIDRVMKEEIGGRDDMNTATYQAQHSDMDTILADAMTIPFFSEKKCVVVENADFLSTKPTTTADLAKLEAYLNQPMNTTVLILTGTFAKLDLRKKNVKRMKDLCQIIVCNKLDRKGMPAYLQEQLQKRGLSLSPKALSCLIQRLPCDIGIIQNELDKLALYGDTIDETMVEQLISRSLEEDVFALVNAVVDKDIRRCFMIWEDLKVLNKDPIYLIALNSSQFHLLYQVKCAQLQGWTHPDEIAAEYSLHPYRVKLALGMIHRFSMDTLLNILAKLAQLDQSIKAGRIDKKLGFELFLLSLKEG